MTQAANFGGSFLKACATLVETLEELRTYGDMVAQNPTLFTQYLSSPGARTDIAAADMAAANSSIGQLLFTFDSGAPAQKAALFNML